MQIINQYSAVWAASLLLAVAGFVLLRRKPSWTKGLALAGIVLCLVLAWALLHPRQNASNLDPTQIQASIGKGTPVLLEFQSPF
jgi:hypothetical protein